MQFLAQENREEKKKSSDEEKSNMNSVELNSLKIDFRVAFQLKQLSHNVEQMFISLFTLDTSRYREDLDQKIQK